jgi:hypothetical protein
MSLPVESKEHTVDMNPSSHMACCKPAVAASTATVCTEADYHHKAGMTIVDVVQQFDHVNPCVSPPKNRNHLIAFTA